MPIFNFMNQTTESPPATQFFGDDDYNFLKANLTGNEWVSAKSALKNSDLFSIINQLSNDLATVRLTANERMQGIIDNPTNNSNRFGFYQSIFAQLLLGGEAFAYRWRNVNGKDVKWEFLRPSQVSVNTMNYEDGLYYNITFDDPKIGAKMNVPQNDILHFFDNSDSFNSSIAPKNFPEFKNASKDLSIESTKTRSISDAITTLYSSNKRSVISILEMHTLVSNEYIFSSSLKIFFFSRSVKSSFLMCSKYEFHFVPSLKFINSKFSKLNLSKYSLNLSLELSKQ